MVYGITQGPFGTKCGMSRLLRLVTQVVAVLVLHGAALAQDIPAAVGRITYGEAPAPGAAICTGVLVAPDLVLTAAHCVRGAADTPETLRFEAGWTVAGPIGQRRGQQVILTGPALLPGLAGLTGDVALILVDPPFSPEEAIPLRLAPPADGDFTLHAFRRDAPDQPAPAVTCIPRATPPGLLGLDCPVVSGNSGAPLLQRHGPDWQIAAVMVAASGSGPIRSWAALPPVLLQQRIPAMGG